MIGISTEIKQFKQGIYFSAIYIHENVSMENSVVGEISD